tara:strand:- start:24428 stop:24904 length:477 start_codon:yes stop_codon:yes gene_type:complete
MDVNKKELGAVFGISERTFTEYQKDGSFPIKEQGGRGRSNTYDTAAVHQWLIAKAQGRAAESTKERLDRLRGDREELAIAKDVGELVPVGPLEQKLNDVVMAIRSTVLHGSSTLKTELDTLYGITIDIDVLHDHSRDILSHLAQLGGHDRPGDREGAE